MGLKQRLFCTYYLSKVSRKSLVNLALFGFGLLKVESIMNMLKCTS